MVPSTASTNPALELFYRLTGSYNVGIGVYTLLQMFLTANVLALTVSYTPFSRIHHPRKYLPRTCCPSLSDSLSPVIQLFSICTTKDVLFTACELLLMMSVLRILGEQDVFFRENKAPMDKNAGIQPSSMIPT